MQDKIRKILKFPLLTFFLCFCSVTIFSIFDQVNIFTRLDYIALDTFYNLREEKKCSEDIVVIAIDEESLDTFGPWPWSRDVIALLINALNTYSSRLVCLDIFFSERFPLTDFFIIEAMKKWKNVSIPVIYESAPVYRDLTGDAECRNGDDDVYSEIFLKKHDHAIGNVWADALIEPNMEIYKNAYAIGHGHAIPDIDGIIRRIPSFINYNNYAVPQFALHAVSKLLNCSVSDSIIHNDTLWIPDNNEITNQKKGIHIPVNRNGEILLNWYGGEWTNSYKIYSARDILISHKLIKDGKQPLLPLDNILKGKICLVGLTALGLMDIKPTPIDNNYPMVGVHANLINSVLNKDFLKEFSSGLKKIISFTYPFLILVLFFLASKKLKPVLVVFSILMWPVIAFCFFVFFNFCIPIVVPVLSTICFLNMILILSFFYQRYEGYRLMLQTITDELTGLYTHRYFKFKLQELFENKTYLSNPFSLLLLDIDNFKNVNDNYGHESGNVVLKGISKTIKTAGKSDCINFRYGGEEFCILLLNSNKSHASEFAEKLLFEIRRKVFDIAQKKIHVTVSIGVVTLPGIICDGPEQFIQAADSAMYYSKRNGKNQFQHYRQAIYMYNPSSVKAQIQEASIKHSSDLEFISIDMKKRNKELESIIKQMQKMQNEILENEKQKMTRELSAYISHELNKPIHNISNCLGIIRNEFPESDVVKEFFRLAFSELNRVADLSKQMFDFYRPSEKILKINNINMLLEDIIKISMKQFQDRGMKIKSELDVKLPDILCSSDELKQVFLNLIMNSCDAMDRGGILKIKTEYCGNVINIIFSDNGRGISEENQRKLFEPFFTTKECEGGTGLGLSVSYNIIKKYNGTIIVKSEEGKGATFTVKLAVE